MLPRFVKFLASTVFVLIAASVGSAHQVSENRRPALTQSGGQLVLANAESSTRDLESRITIFLTGYSYWDNTPPGSAAISKPVIHRRAGGTGTSRDPVTIAVGHSITGGRQRLDFPKGSVFYLPKLRKYVIVEDVCGDGNRPQNGPCHTGKNNKPWLDIYVGGRRAGRNIATACANRITAFQPMILNPRPDYPVVAGELSEIGCRVF